MKYLTPMELLNLFHQSAFADINLTVHEQKFLSVIITKVNGDKVGTNGYNSWPSTETIARLSGLGTTTIENAIKRCSDNGWIHKVSGRGKGSSNQYYINAQKIVDVAAKNGIVYSGKVVASNPVLEEPKEQHVRNTSKLKPNKKKVEVADDVPTHFTQIIEESEPVSINDLDNVVEDTTSKTNQDGSPKYYFGDRCHSWEEYHKMEENKKRIDEESYRELGW
jgi:hypothetical protein